MMFHKCRSAAVLGRSRRPWSRVSLACALAASLFGFLACSPAPQSSRAASPPAPTQQVFQVRGVIKELPPGGKTAVIRHEEVPDYMPAMTMPFDIKNPGELAGLKPGDAVTFRLTVTDKDSWIDQIRAQAAQPPVTNQAPDSSVIKVVPPSVAEPLQIGDAFPEHHFTNELGQAVSTTQFKGQALALTFIFTRCPLPNFCPRMSSNFSDAQKKLLARSGGPTNWHLLTVTFDPEFDTPAILKSHAERLEADPARWNFLTGDSAEITTFAQQVGETFWKEQGAINHNLRTVVVDASGRIQKIITGNNWTGDELVDELVKAAAVPRK